MDPAANPERTDHADALPARLWRALAGNPHRFVLALFGIALALLLLILLRGLLLARDREVDSLRHMQALRAERVDALLHLEAERLLSVRNYAEHLLQIELAMPAPPDADLESAFARRNDDVWSLPSYDAAPVYGVGAAGLQGLDGFARKNPELVPALVVARSLSHLLSAAPQGSGFRRRIAFVSANGLLVAYP